jgi:outer membrane protein assembly factor BamB
MKRAYVIFAILALVSVRAMAIDLTNLWTLKVGKDIGSSPALSPDGTLYFGSEDHDLYAVSTNRFVKWTFKTGLDIKSSPAIGNDGTIYVGSRDRKFYAVTPDGKLKWSFATDGWVDSSPAIAGDGTVYFGSWDKKFYALDSSGARKWIFATAGEIDSSPAIASDGTIYFGSHDKKLYALNPDGTKKWEFVTGGPVISSPAIDNTGAIYFSSVDGKFYKLNSDGTLRWSAQTGGITESSPVLANDGAIYICINKSCAAISPEGKVRWAVPNPYVLLDSTPAVAADGRPFYATYNGMLSAFTPVADNNWGIWLKESLCVSPLIAPDGTIYTISNMGSLNAVEGNTTLMNSAWPMFRANLRHTGMVNSPTP